MLEVTSERKISFRQAANSSEVSVFGMDSVEELLFPGVRKGRLHPASSRVRRRHMSTCHFWKCLEFDKFMTKNSRQNNVSVFYAYYYAVIRNHERNIHELWLQVEGRHHSPCYPHNRRINIRYTHKMKARMWKAG